MRRLNASWLKENPWMRYSTAKDAIYCACCTSFGKRESKAKTFSLSSPVTDWSNLSNFVKRHLQDDSRHHDFVGQGQGFLDVANSKSKSIASSLSSLHDETVAKNRHILSKIIDVIVLCGNQNLPLRGHTEEKSNFKATLKIISKSDKVLAKHLEIATLVKYTSPEIQNELIEICAEQIFNHLKDLCYKSPFLAIIADETTDKATQTQLSVCTRYLETVDTDVNANEIFH